MNDTTSKTHQLLDDSVNRPWLFLSGEFKPGALIGNSTPLPAPGFKQTIKEAALMLLSDLVVMRRGELVTALESHMTATEQGKHFFNVRDAINELIADGLIKRQVVSAGSQEQVILIMGEQSS